MKYLMQTYLWLKKSIYIYIFIVNILVTVYSVYYTPIVLLWWCLLVFKLMFHLHALCKFKEKNYKITILGMTNILYYKINYI